MKFKYEYENEHWFCVNRSSSSLPEGNEKGKYMIGTKTVEERISLLLQIKSNHIQFNQRVVQEGLGKYAKPEH